MRGKAFLFDFFFTTVHAFCNLGLDIPQDALDEADKELIPQLVRFDLGLY
jgi:hypothetical protein